ncbi:hypothetical protein [Runella salmonicolor]|uniref:Carbohydrate-binding domain-containing protein n=1 Tax=Runella salmonicolor TaxID=2950278 RepID=A0ABT1FRT2_9BACT|nr:hypothetical protein [Runella salmonicolor]MCP1384465.1 hypothetical protein [Runella salmonicolor]
MQKLPQLDKLNNSNVQGLDLVRLIDVRDVAGFLTPENVWSGAYAGCLPVGGLVPNEGAVWIEMRFRAGASNHTETRLKSNQGDSWQQTLSMQIPIDSPERAKLVRMLSRGRFIAIRMDANEVVRVVGTVQQPLKLADMAFTTSGLNAWTFSLLSTGPRQAYYINGWDDTDLYGNPADFAFNFSLDFNA